MAESSQRLDPHWLIAARSHPEPLCFRVGMARQRRWPRTVAPDGDMQSETHCIQYVQNRLQIWMLLDHLQKLDKGSIFQFRLFLATSETL